MHARIQKYVRRVMDEINYKPTEIISTQQMLQHSLNLTL